MAPSKVFSFSSLLGNASNKKGSGQNSTASSPVPALPGRDSPQPSSSRNSPSIKPFSIDQPPLLDVKHETPAELLPVFSYLSSHSKKLYTEGYFLKLADLNPDGKPHADREWVECFAQLVGSVLSLWDAGALDAAGEDGEVIPTYLNLTDSTIKMIDTLPTKSADATPLKNVLSISTAGKNRYLFHFNSHHSLTQWTAGIRLSLFELATLQEAYTGALIGGKGKEINGISNLMERTRYVYEDWARVRFAAGEQWQRYWAVVSPPDEKAYQKWKKEGKKDKHPRTPLVLGNVKFYPTKKTKKATPIATVTEAYSAHAVYPQSEALIQHSTLVKIEGKIRSHDAAEAKEGFVFVMPDSHPGVPGFEMMIRWLFPTFDAFHLYGRPGRLLPDVSDIKSIMFGMPRDAKYGYLEVSDVATLISTQRVTTEVEWRWKLKELTLQKMQTLRKATRNSFPLLPQAGTIAFSEDSRSSAGSSPIVPIPPHFVPLTPPLALIGHQRSISEAQGFQLNYQNRTGTGFVYGQPSSFSNPRVNTRLGNEFDENNSDDEGNLFANSKNRSRRPIQLDIPGDIPTTPTMAHPPSSKPAYLPQTPGYQSRMSMATLDAMVAAGYKGPRGRSSPAASSEARTTSKTGDSPRPSHESNMFDVLPSSRTRETDSASPTPPLYPSAGSHTQHDQPAMKSAPGSALNRAEVKRVLQALSNSNSEYGNDVDDYDSTDAEQEAEVKLPARREFSRPGVMKTVGQQKAKDIHIGDSNFKSVALPYQEREPSTDIPAIDFGRTFNHGRSLSATPNLSQAFTNAKAVSKGSVLVTDGYQIHSEHASPVQGRAATQQSNDYFSGVSHRLPPNEVLGASEERKRERHARQPSYADTAKAPDRRKSPGPELDKQFAQGRSMAWQPGLVQPNSAGRPAQVDSAEKIVAEQAAAAKVQSQARNRYAHSRRSSINALRSTTPTPGMTRNISAELIPRPLSRAGNAAFAPHGLVAVAPDLSSHLSAREQEYIARQTGTTLLQMEGGKVRKQPPHQAGLLGAIEAREKEKKDMKDWSSPQVASNNATVQHALAQRQLHVRTVSSSSRVLLDSYSRPQGPNQGMEESVPGSHVYGQHPPQQYGQHSPQQHAQQQQQQQQGYYGPNGYAPGYGNGGR
ncbi:PH domain protein [Peziza echinospora]|nr:PH domain protein [Peziza echinospora]